MAEQRPGDGLEERVRFHIRGASAGAEAAHLVFDEQFADYPFAETEERNSN